MCWNLPVVAVLMGTPLSAAAEPIATNGFPARHDVLLLVGAGAVNNDPFFRSRVAELTISYHPHEVLGLEVQLGTALRGDEPESAADVPDDVKIDPYPCVSGACASYSPGPELSRFGRYAHAALAWYPIDATATILGRPFRVDAFGAAGAGVVATVDDTTIYGPGEPCDGDSVCETHPTTVLGWGLVATFDDWLLARVEARRMTYIEVVSGSSLAVRDQHLVVGSVGVRIPVGRVVAR